MTESHNKNEKREKRRREENAQKEKKDREGKGEERGDTSKDILLLLHQIN